MTATGDFGDRRGMLALGSGDNDERSPPACTGPAEVRPASAGRHEAAVTVHVHIYLPVLEVKHAAAFSTLCN